jgi:DNA repair exonuclease SbcCD ATPase subunit
MKGYKKMEQQVVEYNITNAAIAKMEDLYMALKVSGLDDEEGFSAVHDGRMVVKGKRIEVEKKRKEYKADALTYGRKIDAEAKRIFGLLKPIEDHLQGQEDIITKEKERIKAEEEAKEKAKIENRVSELFALGVNVPFFDLAMLPDNEYAEKLQSAKMAYQAEQLRIAEEEKRLEEERIELERLRKKEESDWKAESDRLEKLAKEQAIEAKRLAKIQADIDAKEKALKEEQDKLEADKKAEQARKDLEVISKRLAAEAKEKAEKDAIEKADREAKELKVKEEAESAEKARLAELAPDKERLLAFAEKLIQAKNDLVPEFKFGSPAYPILSACEIKVDKAIKELIEKTEVM